MNSTSLKQITPVVLTFNEEANLRRNLDSLQWAERVVIVDSGSTDADRSDRAQLFKCNLAHATV